MFMNFNKTKMYLNQAISKIKSSASADSSKSPQKKQKTRDDSPKTQIEPDPFPIEDIVGEALFQKTTLKILNSHKVKALVELATSLSIVDSPEQDLEGTQKLRSLAAEWDKKSMQSAKKMDKTTHLREVSTLTQLIFQDPQFWIKPLTRWSLKEFRLWKKKK